MLNIFLSHSIRCALWFEYERLTKLIVDNNSENTVEDVPGRARSWIIWEGRDGVVIYLATSNLDVITPTRVTYHHPRRGPIAGRTLISWSLCPTLLPLPRFSSAALIYLYPFLSELYATSILCQKSVTQYTDSRLCSVELRAHVSPQ